MDATGVYWQPVWNILSDADFESVLMNAAHVKDGPGRTTDITGAIADRSPKFCETGLHLTLRHPHFVCRAH
jgi:hypothetical protein